MVIPGCRQAGVKAEHVSLSLLVIHGHPSKAGQVLWSLIVSAEGYWVWP
jgi:hypothetical protein